MHFKISEEIPCNVKIFIRFRIREDEYPVFVTFRDFPWLSMTFRDYEETIQNKLLQSGQIRLVSLLGALIRLLAKMDLRWENSEVGSPFQNGRICNSFHTFTSKKEKPSVIAWEGKIYFYFNAAIAIMFCPSNI